MTSSSPTHPALLERFQAVLSDISEGTEGSIDDVLNALTHLDATGDAADATAALRMLGERPGVVLRLDGQVRWSQLRGEWSNSGHPGATAPPAPPAYDRPVALAFACSHSDGGSASARSAGSWNGRAPSSCPSWCCAPATGSVRCASGPGRA
ncbi:hypothetical protein SAZ11_10830 [Streptomyces sp. FXJ1.4098]|nr:hypothetical protein [Streptomyces sp. FXJ1.4098]